MKRARSRGRSAVNPPKPRRWRAVAAVSVLAAGLAGAFLLKGRTTLSPGALRGYNLLLVTIDTLRADRLGCYGSPLGLTPFLDRLAAEGVRFENALAHVPLTLPSHTSIMTGRFPTRHGVHDNGTFRVSASEPTLAATLKTAGYRTGAFVSAFVLDARFGLNRGFDVYDDFYGEKRAADPFGVVERKAELTVAPAERWIESGGSTPWFAWVHLWDPHLPYEAPPDFAARHSEDPYGAEVAYVDATLGGFLERLRRSGALARTLVVVTGDHGESLGEHGEKSHGTFAYNVTLRVPWILWAEHAVPKRVFSPLVRHVDLSPSVLDLLGVAPPSGMDGQTLRPFLAGEKDYDPPPSYFEALNTHLTRNWAPLHGVVAHGMKLIDLPLAELYDLAADPHEKENLYDEQARTARSLQTELESLRRGATETAPAAPDRETLERLRALGYVSAPTSARKTEYQASDDPKRRIDLSNLYDDAAALVSRDPEKAVAILRELVQKEPDSSQAYQELASVLRRSRRLPEAIRVLESAVARGLQDVSLLGLLGSYLLEAGDVKRVAPLMEGLVRRDPTYAEGRNALGVAYSRMGRFEDARREYQALLDLDPSSAGAHNNLGSLALARGDFRGAIPHFEAALRYDPDHASSHNGLGVAYARTGQMEAAVRSWKRAFEQNPEQYDALYNLALALYDRNPREARPYIETFLRTAPRARYGSDLRKMEAFRQKFKNLETNPKN